MKPKVKRLYWPKVKIFITLCVGFIVFIGFAKIFLWGRQFTRETGLTPGVFVRLLFNTGVELSSTENRINVLVLGIAGGNYAGADLTDTIMVLSIDKTTRTMAMISVPRDIWSDTLKDKINSAYHYGNEKKRGGGIVLAKAIIEDVVGLPIHYTWIIDFSGFEKIIDLVGGVTIDIPQAFVDEKFPIAGKETDLCDGDPQLSCRYQVVQFEKGKQNLDGIRALQYVRSRQAEGDEGSDFARSRRQQDVLLALKDRLMQPKVWISRQRIVSLINAFDQATDTDMNIGEILTLGKTVGRIKDESTQRISIDDLLTAPPLWLYGRYVLVPIEDYQAIHAFIRSQLQQLKH